MPQPATSTSSSKQHRASPATTPRQSSTTSPTATRIGPSVGLSQSSLYFPLPIAQPIENVLQLVNVETSRVAFKVRSTIQQRYDVRPTQGYLHPKEVSIVKFLIHPDTMADVEGNVPSETTKDSFILDFAFVPKELETLTPQQFWRALKESREVRDAAANGTPLPSATKSSVYQALPPAAQKIAFAASNEIGKRRLPCLFTTSSVKEERAAAMAPGTPLRGLPDNLTLRFSTQEAGGGSSAALTPASSGATKAVGASSSSHFAPLMTPKTVLTGTPVAAVPLSGSGNPRVGSSSTTSATAPPLSPRMAGKGGEFNASPAETLSTSSSPKTSRPKTISTPEEMIGPCVPQREPFVRAFIQASIPLPVALLFFLLAFLSALAERQESGIFILIRSWMGV